MHGLDFGMEIRRYHSASEFLEVTAEFRATELVRTNLISSIAASVANGSRKYDAYYWWVIEDSGKTLGIASRTAPYGYVFSPMPKSVILDLVSRIKKEDPDAREFAGPKAVIDQLVMNEQVMESESELIYELKDFKPINSLIIPRRASMKDYELVLDWIEEFIQETNLRSFNTKNIVRGNIDQGNYFILEVNGEPVSLGGHVSQVEILDKKIGRVGPIYTPKKFRKRGYASALTSFISQLLIDQGSIATLYTQADNPTSNKIYQNIGYVLVEEIRRVRLK